MSDVQEKKDLSPSRTYDAERTTSSASSSEDTVAHVGVKKVEAAQKVYGKYSKWALFISLGLAAYIYSLDGTTTYSYLSFAASSLGGHSLISTIQIAQSVIVAVGKPVVAKIADVSSRGTAYVFVCRFSLGYIVIASAQNIQTIAGGIILYAVGNTGLQLLTQIIIADITVLKWRGLVAALMSLPFIINAFVGSNISASVIQGAGWRWGYGMFAILVPAALSPLIVTLLWAEKKAKKLGIVPKSHRRTAAITAKDEYNTSPTALTKKPITRRLLSSTQKLDVPGLVLIGASVSLILLPLTLAENARNGWRNPSMVAMLVVGIVLIPAFILWDLKYAKYPVVARRFVFNKTVVIAALIGAFDFISFYITFTYLYSFVIVVKPWSLVNATYFAQTQTVALTIFAIVGGILMRFLHRYKYIVIVGLTIRIIGVGLMIHSRGANASDAEVVWTQILQGMGGGFAAVASQVGAQASVPHADVAMVTAIVLLITEIGGAIGSAIAGAIWTNMMPNRLAVHLPFLTQEMRDQLYGSIVSAAANPRGTPVREGVIQAYDDVMEIMIIVATVFAVIPLVLSFFLPNWYLGDKQNAVEDVDLTGERREQGESKDTHFA
ncbi:drug:h+ antiporter [Crucibulum laeve]|uniref:Drug:h+ antiporter n=1 Tax=Crucibulum laeve TaxID=68775 RepID=A0A5C3LRW5_9AGAR|nr:drug:h+ antiporter [Crucibulum laeve]